jgi:hypothetical protein
MASSSIIFILYTFHFETIQSRRIREKVSKNCVQNFSRKVRYYVSTWMNYDKMLKNNFKVDLKQERFVMAQDKAQL